MRDIINVQKWPYREPPTETMLRQDLEEEGLEPFLWSADPGAVYDAQTVPYGRTIYVLEGTITFGFPIEAEPTTLRRGDRLDLPANVPHNAAVGFEGVTCLEARRE